MASVARVETIPNPNPNPNHCGSRVETIPNPDLIAQFNLLLMPIRAFPMQPTANAESTFPSATYC